MDRKREQRLERWQWLALVPLVLAVAAVAVPLMWGHEPGVALALQRGFALVCHQRAERSLIMFGGNVAVCARCLGIYLGAAAGLLLRVSREWAWRWFIVAFAVNALDWASEFVGLHGNWMGTRFLLGAALGATAAMFVISAAAANWRERAQAVSQR